MSLKFAILGVLELKPHTGYDLKKTIEASVAHFWSADQSQIYRTLALLVADGLAEVEVITQDGRPDRRLHRITPTGLTALHGWLASPLPPETPHDAFLVRVFFVGELGIPAATALLQARRAEADAVLFRLTALVGQDGGEAVDLAHTLRRATLRNGIRHAAAELAWLAETVEALS
ncbi:PadR family transcriptional regulator [Cryobacterium sp. HLT2-28]|uniref:PadR family transcriptional regulator n=1 Tax=Cryobacterium sp. HLT2-28 TaxID=1259146 RepID=UPI00106B73F7|nr:PadR family transcriptional regulator [Cryobacterium sp. HLT2-28]TFB92602.1 PadR family transcriptional regulator [Cryobacterium sp. HLT2-28]